MILFFYKNNCDICSKTKLEIRKLEKDKVRVAWYDIDYSSRMFSLYKISKVPTVFKIDWFMEEVPWTRQSWPNIIFSKYEKWKKLSK